MTRFEGSSSTGTLRPTRGGHFAQFSIGHGQRKGVLLRGMTEAEAERRKLALAKLVRRLCAGGGLRADALIGRR
jgi:hypothetical protein